ncbi:MAG TPA: AI-2E family transporter [Pirellulaceae bacterium]|nr:AI-2E family transporter [Pirellulaceae bacterium]
MPKPDESLKPASLKPAAPAPVAFPDPGRVSLVILAVLAIAAAVTWLGPILKPLLTAVFLFFVTRSAERYLSRRGWSPWVSYLMLFAATVIVATIITVYAYGEADSFRAQWPDYRRTIEERLRPLGLEPHESWDDLFRDSSMDVIGYVFERGLGIVEFAVMTFFYLLFMIIGAQKMPARVKRAFPGERSEAVLRIADEISRSIEQFMRVKTIVSLGMGASAAILMWAFGLDRWLLWGFLFFALNYITYIGSIAACVPPIVLALVSLDLVWAIALSVLLIANRLLWIDYVEIKLSGKHLNLSSVLLFVWLAYWGWVWGVLGLILAYPMLASLKLALEHFDATRKWAVLMGDD